MQFPNSRILIFAKAPIPGHAKTRLIPALGKQGAAALQAKLTQHILHIATTAKLCPVELWCADNIDHPFYQQCKSQYPITVKIQHGKDLGERMHQAMSHSLEHCHSSVLIGTDCPAMTATDLTQALQVLENKRCVFKPAEDGGYVLVGLNKETDELFNDIDWGTARVMQQTIDKLNAAQHRYELLDTTWDLDRPEDLEKLSQLNATLI